jgi:hypothetical protein
LEDTQIDSAIGEALRLFNRYLYEYESRTLASQDGAVSIQLEDDVTGVMYLKCLFPATLSVYLQMNIFELMYRMVFPKLPIGEWYQLRSFYEMYQRIRGTEPDWHYDQFNHILLVDCNSGPYDIAFIVAKKLTMDSINIGWDWYEYEFYRAVLAQSKKILARIRGKFSNSLPAPAGNLTIDSSELQAQAEQEWKDVEERLKGATPPVPILIG